MQIASAHEALTLVFRYERCEGQPRMLGKATLDHAGTLPVVLSKEFYYRERRDQVPSGMMMDSFTHLASEFIARPRDTIRNTIEIIPDAYGTPRGCGVRYLISSNFSATCNALGTRAISTFCPNTSAQSSRRLCNRK